MKKINFKVKNQKIKGTLFYPDKIKPKNPAVIFIHGWTSSKKGYTPRAQAVSKKGAICLTYNLRGHGNSEGTLDKLSRQDHLQDTITAYDFLISQPNIDKNNIGVVGSSYGGYLAAILTSKRKIKWLVLRVPALYQDKSFKTATKKIILNDEKVYRQYKLKPQGNMALSSVSKFQNDLLIIESEKDEVIPRQTLLNYKNAVSSKANLDYMVIKGADHALGKRTDNNKWRLAYIKILKNWFSKKFN
ncbi:alpha/beta hydrolase family protein [Patescibacteria group bacterium]